ncbi:response regulator [Desulfobacterales bacterium HSG17]|nr:response regulator [Desulfobacterales bacterium HSG17]
MEILIAEDDLTSRRILETVLSKWGFDVISVDNGNDAVDRLLEAKTPKLCLLDWIMPGKDGVEVCSIIRNQENPVSHYLILLTGKSDKNDIAHGLDSGADDYIVKPYDKDELKARINAGSRILKLQNAMAEKEKFQGVLEISGAICHELNQPLMVLSGYSEILLMDYSEDHPQYKAVKEIHNQATRMGVITKKLMKITHYKTKPYLKGNIVDINEASQKTQIEHENKGKNNYGA